jgi:HD-GYP domain-containing protein (c-di-GMP phosphodiesterase class II)
VACGWDAIFPCTRIVAVVDVFVTLLRAAENHGVSTVACDRIEQRSGSQFDPEVVTLDTVDHEPQHQGTS